MRIFDINAGCGHWPFWPTKAGSPAELELMLRREGVERACAYPLEAYLWPDPMEANELYLPELAASPFFVPSAVLNPTLPNVLKSYRYCREAWHVPLIRVMPGYHCYDLRDPGLQALANQMAEDNTVLAIHVRAQDERSQNPLAPVKPVPLADVVEFTRFHPSLTVLAVAFSHPSEMRKVSELNPPANLFIELSFYEFGDTLQSIMSLFPVNQLIFGTHTPIFYPRSPILKIAGSKASDAAKSAVLADNGLRLLGLD